MQQEAGAWKAERVSSAPRSEAVELAVIGGSGLYSLFEDARQVEIATPFGPAAAPITVGTVAGRSVAFLPRHGRGHALPPSRIPYRANIWALASLGVGAVLTSSAVGGLRADLAPGTFVVPDQIVDRTTSRTGTFYDGAGDVQHLAAADPFDTALRAAVNDALAAEAAPSEARGTAVVIEGPRFSTRAESAWFAAQGGDIINMTLAPETFLAMEAGIAVVNLSFVTDSDAAVGAGHADAVDEALVFRRLAEAQPAIRRVLLGALARIPAGHRGTGFGSPALSALLARPVV